MSELGLLYPLERFGRLDPAASDGVSYWYEGRCPRTGAWLRLPRTDFVETIARGLMQQLAEAGPDAPYSQEGKMYGVLLVQTGDGLGVLKAFSGLLNGQRQVAGWVPPISDPVQLAAEEAQTLNRLEQIKQTLLALQQRPEPQRYQTLKQEFDAALGELAAGQRQAKQVRQQQRQRLSQTLTGPLSGPDLQTALAELDRQSQQEGIARRRFKQQWQPLLQPLQQQVEQIEAQIRSLKQERRQLSRQLQTQMHATYRLSNFAGHSASLTELVLGTGRGGLPTGTGDCCAPKLLHWAAIHGWRPLALAEFWWGRPEMGHPELGRPELGRPELGRPELGRIPGQFYAACQERCQPLLGFLLSGLAAPDLPILYEDDWLLAIDKPAGLLSVPGRSGMRQDSVIMRLAALGPVWPLHRLDQDTSGILLLARDRQTQRLLSQQFQQRQVHKLYEALLGGKVAKERGQIDLPLWGDPANRPYQTVDWQRGKPSQTAFRLLEHLPDRNLSRLELRPLTGRTHQLRVHSAHPQGLNAPIWGDRLYGPADSPHAPAAVRLHLHAKALKFTHPYRQEPIHLQTETPFV